MEVTAITDMRIIRYKQSWDMQKRPKRQKRQYYFFEKLKIVEKQLCKLNCSYGKISHTHIPLANTRRL